MKLSSLKVKTRLLLSFCITLLFTLAIALAGLSGLKNANQNLHEFINQQYAADTAVKMCRIEANNAARTIRDMYIDPNTANYAAYEQKVEDGIQGLEDNLAALKSTYTENDGLVSKYETAINKWIEIGRRALKGLEEGRHDEVQGILLNECSPALEDVVSIARDLDASTSEMKEAMLNESLRSANQASVVVIIMLILSTLLGIAIALMITKSIVKPLQEVDEAAQNMSKGILSTEIKYEGKDVIGDVAESMRNSMRTLSSYIHDIDDAMTNLANGNFDINPSQHFVGDFKNIELSILSFISTMSSTLAEINQASEQVSGGSDHVAYGAQALSQGATEQAASVEELSATISQISKQVKQNADHAQQANITVDQLSGHLLESNQQMTGMIKAMEEINKSSSEIGKIIKTIEDIAFQTNILALNAAVEAARAGVAGKGFAVVADEVRSLASKSGEASKSTSELIERSLRAVEHGSKIADDTAKSLLAVVEEAKAITSGVDQIAQASEEQSKSITQVTMGIDQITNVVQTNSATAQESAASSEELSGQAQTLKSLVSRFRLRSADQRSSASSAPVQRGAVELSGISEPEDSHFQPDVRASVGDKY